MPEEILVEKDNRTGLCASYAGAHKFKWRASVRRWDHHAHQNQRHWTQRIIQYHERGVGILHTSGQFTLRSGASVDCYHAFVGCNCSFDLWICFFFQDYLGTEKLMMEKLTRQVNGRSVDFKLQTVPSLMYLDFITNTTHPQLFMITCYSFPPLSEWSWNNLNRLCWAIGSISGTMAEQLEKVSFYSPQMHGPRTMMCWTFSFANRSVPQTFDRIFCSAFWWQ